MHRSFFSSNTGTALVQTRTAEDTLPDTLKTVSNLSEDGGHLYCKLVNLADRPKELAEIIFICEI